MPELFPDVATFVLCALIMVGAQMIYATVGFGAGMFSIALLALVLPDLAGAVAMLLVLTAVTEVWVLAHAWRRARFGLLLGLLPTMVLGMWLGTRLLVSCDVGGLKRVLGVVVAGAGVWFICQQRARSHAAEPGRRSARGWTSVPAGLVSGVLGGLFGTGGPPVIVFLRGYGLDKGAFRATLLCYFLLMTVTRAGTYVQAGVLTRDVLLASAWLLPPSVIGILLGMVTHRRLSEQRFSLAVSALLVVLGLLLLSGVGE